MRPSGPCLSVTTESVGAAQVWGTLGAVGRGIGVAVIDSGIAPHPDIRNKIVAEVDFTGEGTTLDLYGHGTHVAGIIAGSGSGSDDYTGVAPGAHLINLRVLGADGLGLVSAVVEALDWAVANKDVYGIRVANLSVGAPVTQSYRDDPMAQAVRRATDAGILVACSAGNLGKTDDGTPQWGGIVAPGNSPDCLTAGAVNGQGTPERSDDVMTTYSSRGPTAIDLLVKPDLVALGNAIVSLEAEGSYLSVTYPSLHVAGEGAASYFQLSGTSMAAAVTSGTAALLLEGSADAPAIQCAHRPAADGVVRFRRGTVRAGRGKHQRAGGVRALVICRSGGIHGDRRGERTNRRSNPVAWRPWRCGNQLVKCGIEPWGWGAQLRGLRHAWVVRELRSRIPRNQGIEQAWQVKSPYEVGAYQEQAVGK